MAQERGGRLHKLKWVHMGRYVFIQATFIYEAALLG